MRNDHTTEERLEAVLACLEGGRALKEAAQAYQVEVQTLRSWVKKYQELGSAGLEDRRGKRLADQTPRSRDDKERQKKSTDAAFTSFFLPGERRKESRRKKR